MNDRKLPRFSLPPRYAPVSRLGRGGGGEVWAVRDLATGTEVALKVLAEDAAEAETLALVREAIVLSGLEGLGVPRVLAFGRLPKSGRRYLVRELVSGTSLDDIIRRGKGPWLEPLAHAADQLTVLHRAGLLHGDIKPANIIVGDVGAGTLVDLGQSAPWLEGGSRAHGLTPKFAAPELLRGEPLTVRAEVYALGATLGEGVEGRGGQLDPSVRARLSDIVARATQHDPRTRYPSIDELASAVRNEAGMAAPKAATTMAWPVLEGGFTEQLVRRASQLAPGDALAIVGSPRSGRTTILRRLSWSLGVAGTPVANVTPRTEAIPETLSPHEMIAREIRAAKESDGRANLVVMVDDIEQLDDRARDELRAASEAGARIVAVGSLEAVERATTGKVHVFGVPPLDPANAHELLRRAIPSLPKRLVDHLIDRVNGSPGALRSFVERLGGRAVTSAREIDALLDDTAEASRPSTPPRKSATADLERMLDTGRFNDAAELLDALEAERPPSDRERLPFGIARAKIALARGDAETARTALEAVESLAAGSSHERAWSTTRARTFTRTGDFARAREFAGKAVRAKGGALDALSADALAVEGVAAAYLGDDERALAALDEAVSVAESVEQPRIRAVVFGSLAIVHQRAGRAKAAREAYESALVAAEKAQDAWTLATTHLNLASAAKADGDLAQALTHLEAAVDMGRRAGGHVAVQQALLNLANLDLYVGRYARTKASIDGLSELESALPASSRAYLLALRAELAARTGERERATELYALSADAYDAVARPLDAAEARLEGMLARLTMSWENGDAASRSATGTVDVHAIEREFERLRDKLGEGGFLEHEGLAKLVEGALARARGDEADALATFQLAYERAMAGGQREWAWRALDARARLAGAQGSFALAKRDTETALAILEEIAVKLPRDLREVFWNDPRRRALRQAQFAAPSSVLFQAPPTSALGSTTDPFGMTSFARSLHGRTSIGFGTPLPSEDRLARIFEITRDLAREHDLDRLLTRVTDHAVGLLGAERGFIVLEGESGELVVHTSRDAKGEEAAQHFSRSVAERVIQEGAPVLATSACDDERLAKAVSVHQLMIQSVACVPIRGAPPAGQTIGALYVETRLRPGTRFRDELPTLSAFADQAAIAIEGARLLAENKRRADELEATNDELRSAKDRLAELLGRRTEQLHTARRDLKQARAELRSHFGYAGLVGTSAAMRKLYALIERVKDADVPVLVTGESGTGKEVVARAIHAMGARAKEPFLGVNCGAIPANLLESELFGHVRGAFTGADRDRKGLFREAREGTLMLDEVGEMPLKMQAGLLRVLQEKTVRPVGGVTEEPSHARVVAATNRDLAEMVAQGTFREDLYYRLHVIELRIPPLRERAEDIPALVDHFLTLFSARHKRERKTIARSAIRALSKFEWPGNVRQLEHVLLNAWLLSEENEIGIEDLDLPASITSSRSSSSSAHEKRSKSRSDKSRSNPRTTSKSSSTTKSGPRPKSQDEFRATEKKKILEALARCQWNRLKAAEMIGLPRRTFYRRLKEYGIV